MLSKTNFYKEYLKTQRRSFKNVLGLRDSIETKLHLKPSGRSRNPKKKKKIFLILHS